MSRETGRAFGRFLVVGAINTGFGYAVYALLIWLGLSAQPALMLAFAIGVLWNYFTTARLVFRVGGYGRIPQYVGCYLAIYATNAASLQVLLGLGLHPLLAQALLTPVFAVAAFVLISWALTGRIGGAG